MLAGRGVLDLAAAWDLVCANPAAAAGLSDRGAIAEGKRADVVIVSQQGAVARVVATIAQGRLAYLDAEGSRRLR